MTGCGDINWGGWSDHIAWIFGTAKLPIEWDMLLEQALTFHVLSPREIKYGMNYTAHTYIVVGTIAMTKYELLWRWCLDRQAPHLGRTFPAEVLKIKRSKKKDRVKTWMDTYLVVVAYTPSIQTIIGFYLSFSDSSDSLTLGITLGLLV